MVWVSNHTAAMIVVSITNASGGSADNFNVEPCIPYGHAIPERSDNNWWTRNGPEVLTAQVGGNNIEFDVGQNDHVTIYENGYEIFAANWGWF